MLESPGSIPCTANNKKKGKNVLQDQA